MHSYLIPLIKSFEQNADAANAEGMKAYMLNQFDYYGLKTPLRRKLSKEYFKQSLPPFINVEEIVKVCWQHPSREMQYIAVELLACYKKQWKKDTIQIIEYILIHKSWWDSVDHAATDLTGPYFKLFPEQIENLPAGGTNHQTSGCSAAVLCFKKLIKKKQIKICSQNTFFTWLHQRNSLYKKQLAGR